MWTCNEKNYKREKTQDQPFACVPRALASCTTFSTVHGMDHWVEKRMQEEYDQAPNMISLKPMICPRTLGEWNVMLIGSTHVTFLLRIIFWNSRLAGQPPKIVPIADSRAPGKNWSTDISTSALGSTGMCIGERTALGFISTSGVAINANVWPLQRRHYSAAHILKKKVVYRHFLVTSEFFHVSVEYNIGKCSNQLQGLEHELQYFWNEFFSETVSLPCVPFQLIVLKLSPQVKRWRTST